MSECDDVPVFVEIKAPSVWHGSNLDVVFLEVISAWQSTIRDVIVKASWMGEHSVIFNAVHDSGKDFIEFKGVIKRSEVIPVTKTVSKIFTEIGIVQDKMKIKIYDPCKCQG